MLTKSNLHTVPPRAGNYKNTPVAPHYFNLFVETKKNGKDKLVEESPSNSPKMKVAYHILQLMVSSMFIASSLLLWMADVPVYLFSFKSGIPVSFLYAVSIIAFLLALIQLFPVTGFAAQLGLTLISIALAGVLLITGSPILLLLPALLLLLLTLSAICLNYKLASPDTSNYKAFEQAE